MSEFWRDPKIIGVGLALAIGMSACGGGNNKSVNLTRTPTTTPETTPDDYVYVPQSDCKYTNNHPQPLVKKHPPQIKVASECNPPRDAPVGVYPEASFGSQSIGKVMNGDLVRIICIDPEGQQTTDVRGPESASKTWVKIAAHDGTAGYVSEVNLGYVDDSLYKKCD